MSPWLAPICKLVGSVGLSNWPELALMLPCILVANRQPLRTTGTSVYLHGARTFAFMTVIVT